MQLSRRRLALALALSLPVGLIETPVASSANQCTQASRDTDRDHIADCWERRNGLTVGRRDQFSNRDADYLTAYQEYRIDVRTAGDGIFAPYQADERSTPGTGPFVDGYKDLDGDGYFNAAEFTWGTDPVNPSSHPIAPSSGCWSVPPRVKDDGSRSVTLMLQTVIDTVPDGACLRLGSGARYRSNGELTITDKTNYTLDGNGATIFTREPGRIPPGEDLSDRQHLIIERGSDVSLHNLKIVGPNPRPRFVFRYQAEAGLRISGTQGAVISDVKVTHVYGDLLTVGKSRGLDGERQPARGVLVTGSRFTVSGGVGLNLATSSDGVTISGNTFASVGRSGIDLEIIPGMLVTNLVIENNTFSHTKLYWLGSRARGQATNVSLIGNQLIGESMQAKMGPSDSSGVRHQNWLFDSNVSDTPMHGTSAIFNIRNLDGLIITGNSQAFVAGARGRVVAQHNSCGILIEGDNNFTNIATLVDPVSAC